MSLFFEEELYVFYVVLAFLTLLTLFSLLDINFNTKKNNNKISKIVSIEAFETEKLGINADMATSHCEKYDSTPHLIEKKCNTFSSRSCNASSCCVWVNGGKCVAGNKNGPTYHTDNTGKNIDVLYYHHKNKCVGNCPPTNS